MNRRMLRAREVSDLLGLHPRTVVSLVASGKLPGTRLGGQTLVPYSAVEELLGEPVLSEPSLRDSAGVTPPEDV